MAVAAVFGAIDNQSQREAVQFAMEEADHLDLVAGRLRPVLRGQDTAIANAEKIGAASAAIEAISAAARRQVSAELKAPSGAFRASGDGGAIRKNFTSRAQLPLFRRSGFGESTRWRQIDP